MLLEEEVLLIIYFISVIFIVIVFVLVFFLVFQKRKNKILNEKLMMEVRYKNEIAKTKVEIQEQTLKNVAWELHDNIGQLLSVVNLQLNMMSGKSGENFTEHLKETKSLVQTTVQEVRSLSKTLNSEVIKNNGLIRSIEIEMERIERLKYAKTSFEISGKPKEIKHTDEIILFRIIQEFLSNTIKYAKAKKIGVFLNYTQDFLYLSISDNGKGFDTSQKTESSGLQNMKNRAQLLNADFSHTSVIGEGTQLILTYKLSK
ncbi:MAG: ATP-binding protein [Flavobacteriaceae bacterium]